MINIDYDKITDMDKAINIIRKLQAGLNNCVSANFTVCVHCGAITTQGWLCYECNNDPTGENL